jgi:hypothetical protein
MQAMPTMKAMKNAALRSTKDTTNLKAGAFLGQRSISVPLGGMIGFRQK